MHIYTQRDIETCYRLLKAKRNSVGWRKPQESKRLSETRRGSRDGFHHVSSVLVRD